jgi:hypothetical protein
MILPTHLESHALVFPGVINASISKNYDFSFFQFISSPLYHIAFVETVS